MNVLDILLSRTKKLNQDKILKVIYQDPKVRQFIRQLNTEGQPTSQLYNLGIDSEGKELTPPYSVRTIQEKLFGDGDRRIDHVTLKDTGEFYESFTVKPLKDGFEINGNPIKDEDDLTAKYGEDIFGLSEENKTILSEFLQPFIQEEVKKALLG